MKSFFLPILESFVNRPFLYSFTFSRDYMWMDKERNAKQKKFMQIYYLVEIDERVTVNEWRNRSERKSINLKA